MRRGIPPPEIYGAGYKRRIDRYPSSIKQTSADAAPADITALKAYLRIVGDSQNTELTATLQAANRLVADTFRIYTTAATLEMRWQSPARIISLPVLPLITISAVVAERDDGEMNYDAASYQQETGDDGNPQLRFVSINPPMPVLRLTVSVGFNPAPDSLLLAARIIAASFYERRAMHNATADLIPPTARAILNQHAPAGIRLG